MSIHGSADASLFKAPLPEGRSLTHTNCDQLPLALGRCCPLVATLRSQHSAAPTTARPIDNNGNTPCAVRPVSNFGPSKTVTSYDRRRKPIEVSNVGSRTRHLCTTGVSCVWHHMSAPSRRRVDRLAFCRIRNAARPMVRETKLILAAPVVRRLPQWVLVLLQHMKYHLRSCGLGRRKLGRGAGRNARDD